VNDDVSTEWDGGGNTVGKTERDRKLAYIPFACLAGVMKRERNKSLLTSRGDSSFRVEKLVSIQRKNKN